MNPILIVVVFCSAAVGDVLWSRWMMCVAARRAVMSSVFAALIFLVGSISIDSYVRNIWYVVPAAAGGALGTYVSVKKAPHV